MNDFLASMAAASAARAAQADPGLTTARFDKPIVPLALGAFDVIAEIKDRSPAEGELADDAGDRAGRARLYAAGGAAAISVLTEPSRFGGELGHLEQVAAAVPGTPVMRKDFLVEPVQVLEARAAGASGVLLIVTMLDDAKLAEMLDCAFGLGLFVLLESFDAADLGRVTMLLERGELQARAASGQLLAGVNTRNLRSLEVDSARLTELAALLPDARCVAESGMVNAADAAAAAALGYRLVLVGTALMRSSDPGALVAAMRNAGRARVAA